MSQAMSFRQLLWSFVGRWGMILTLLVAGCAAALTFRQWQPVAERYWNVLVNRTNSLEPRSSTGQDLADENHEPGHHEHGGHDETESIEVSAQARRNIGLEINKVVLQSFSKSLSVPGMVVERPGRSVIEVTAPMTGVIKRIYPIEGEAVEPGQKLFDLRLTHEELVQSQADLLQTAEELDVTRREIQRIESVTAGGALAGKQLLERQYESQKLEAVLRSKRQALLLHGLTSPQIDEILERRELLKDLTVAVPQTADDGDMVPTGVLFQVQSLKTAHGQHVNAGDTLAILVDHAELYIEGAAFERDVSAISRASDQSLPVSAIFETEGGRPEVVPELRILYLAAQVNSDTRTLDFYVTLPNEKQRDARLDAHHRFIAWRHRPGQRVQLQIPVEVLADRIVLPIDAVAQDGVETYVFIPNGEHFDRRSVHVEYRDLQWAVIANDGAVFPGDLVVTSGAQQLQLALKNKSGGHIDPHAGHTH